jgi:hypothetical protein
MTAIHDEKFMHLIPFITLKQGCEGIIYQIIVKIPVIRGGVSRKANCHVALRIKCSMAINIENKVVTRPKSVRRLIYRPNDLTAVIRECGV